MASREAQSVSEDVAEDDTKILAEAAVKFGNNFEQSKVVLDDIWSYYHARTIPSHNTDRLVIFRPKAPSKIFGCIRVLDTEDEDIIWEIVRQEGVYIGHIPAGSSFEALLVEVKLITTKT